MTHEEPSSNEEVSTVERLLAAAAALSEAVVAHADALAAIPQGDHTDAAFEAASIVFPAIVEYAQAQEAHVGEGFPMRILVGVDEDVPEPLDLPDEPAMGVSVVVRHDYRVDDEHAVMDAAADSSEDLWGEREDPGHLGRAIYLLSHAHGWDVLRRTPGLRPTGGVAQVVRHENLLEGEPDDWPDDPFDLGDADPIYGQADVWS